MSWSACWVQSWILFPLFPGRWWCYLELIIFKFISLGESTPRLFNEGKPLWPPTVPRLAGRSSQSNPRGSGPEVLKRELSEVTWPTKSGVSEVVFFSHYLNQWWIVYYCIYASLGLNELMASVGSQFTLSELIPSSIFLSANQPD